MDASPGMMTQVILAQTTVKANGRQVPIPFELTFDPARAELTHPYSVRAVIRSNGRSLYESPREARVIMLTAPSSVDLMVSRVQSDAPAAASLEQTSWRLEDFGGAGVIDNVAATLGQAQRYQMQGPMLPITDQGSDKPLRFLRAEQSAHVIITSVCPRSCAMRIT